MILHECNPRIEIVRADCMDYMKDVPENAFSIAIPDPPYGINAPNMQMGTHKTRTGDGYPGESVAVKLRKGRLNSVGGKLKNRLLNTSDINWDDEKPSPEYFTTLKRISKNQLIWGGNYFDLGPTRGFAIWNKNQPWPSFSQAEFCWSSFDCPSKVFTYSNRGGANEEVKIHPTQKPVPLYLWLLDTYAKKGDTILDTHLGSGSSMLAAYARGFDFVGIEKDILYYEAAVKRFMEFMKQPLFKEYKQGDLFTHQ